MGFVESPLPIFNEREREREKERKINLCGAPKKSPPFHPSKKTPPPLGAPAARVSQDELRMPFLKRMDGLGERPETGNHDLEVSWMAYRDFPSRNG